MAIGAYTASGIAGSNPTRTAWTAVRIALAGFVIPYIFVLNPSLLFTGRYTAMGIVVNIMKAFLAILALSYVSEGFLFRHLSIVLRFAFAAVTALLVYNSEQLLWAGVVAFAVLLVLSYVVGRGEM